MNRLAQAAMVSLGLLAATGVQLSAKADTLSETRSKVNQNVVGIMAGTPGSTDLTLAADLGLAFSEGYDLRIVSMVSQGSVREVEDVLFLRGVDMAVVSQDVVKVMAENNVHPNMEDRIRLIAPLGFDQFHVLARDDIATIYDLAGQKVNYGPSGTGTFTTSSVVFDTLNIDVEVMTDPHKEALEKLRTGEIAAMIRASAKPVATFDDVQQGEPLHFLSLPVESLASTYAPTTLTATDYPAVIDPGEQVTTVAVANTLICYNWAREHPRGQAIARFSERFITGFSKLLDGAYHESWKDIDIAAPVPGMQRYWAVEEVWRSVTQ